MSYQIPRELTTIVPIEVLSFEQPKETKTIFLNPNEEKFFLDFPTAWKETLDNAFKPIYQNGSEQYTISVISYDGNNILSHSQKMFGIAFKEYLACLLRATKTVTLFILNGFTLTKYIICQA